MNRPAAALAVSAWLVLIAGPIPRVSTSAHGLRQAGRRTAASPAPRAQTGVRTETLKPVNAVPAEITGSFQDPVAFQQVRSGQYYVFDRRAQAVFALDRDLTGAWVLVRIGQEPGRIYQPHAFASEANGNFVVADQPGRQERLQIFTSTGFALGGFGLPARAGTGPIVVGGAVVNGIGTLQYAGRSIFANLPWNGALVTEFSEAGTTVRSFGTLRPTGHEADRDLHLALNTAIPIVNPRGGFYVVFQAGVPLFRKYDQNGSLVFERHVEGRELDSPIAALPGEWTRRIGPPGEEVPFVTPLVRAAAADPGGNLWISLSVPYTYVYNPDGDKIRVVQFRAAGFLSPSSLFFAPTGRLLVTPGCYEFAPGS